MDTTFTGTLGKKLRGVNLGSWLVIEKWMVPSLFYGLKAEDETSFCVELGPCAAPILTRHWRTFITRDDFAWIAARGLNAVRIPLGFWLFGPDYPYHPAYGDIRHPFVQGGLAILDQAFDWAEEFGLHIVLDLHAAPGCQNGFDNGGIKDVCEWHTQADYIGHSLDVLERLAARYQASPALYGIETLNEPRWDIPTDLLKDYHTQAYRRIRKHCPPERVAVVFHDGFRPYGEYSGFLAGPDFCNVIFDIHRYQCFVPEDLELDVQGHITKSVVAWGNEADAINAERGHGTVVGEWSLGIDLRPPPQANPADGQPLQGLDGFQTEVAHRAHASAQLVSFEKYLGWFFWSYKTEQWPGWCFRECVERGWLPSRFD